MTITIGFRKYNVLIVLESIWGWRIDKGCQKDVDPLVLVDLNILYQWCANNNATLNINKCQIMTFFQAPLVTNNNFIVNGELHHRFTRFIKDFYISFNLKPKINSDINNVIKKSHQIFGFISKNQTGFTHIIRKL